MKGPIGRDGREIVMQISDRLRVITLVRHGETEGESSIRFHGANDVPLSADGRTQAREAATLIASDAFQKVIASSLSRADETARLVAPDRSIRVDDDLQEVHFGRWEGLTHDEIKALDPELHAEWRESPGGFDYPEGERRTDFIKRVDRGLARAFNEDADWILVVAHKGVVRRAIEKLCGAPPPQPHPLLGAVLRVRRTTAGDWRLEGP